MKSICTFATMGLVLTLPALCSAASYTVIDLGTLGGDFSEGNAVNEAGQGAGTSRVNNSFPYQHGVLFQNGNQTDLGTLGGVFSQAFDINNSGQIVGFADLSNGLSKPTLWQNGVPQDLAPSAFIGHANGINDAGQVVGYTAGDQTRAFLWTEDDGLMYIGTLGGNASVAADINASGKIVGSSFPALNNPSHAFLYDGTMHDLATLGGTTSDAYAINDNGLIVGDASLLGDSVTHAFLYDGMMHDLDTLGGGNSRALDINNSGQVVGYSFLNSVYHPFLYRGGVMTDLNTLIDPLSGWVLQSAHGINDSGQITGNGFVIVAPGHMEEHGFLLTPVPEPSGLILSVFSLLGLIAWGWRSVS